MRIPLLLSAIFFVHAAQAATPMQGKPGEQWATPISSNLLDSNTFRVWVDGLEAVPTSTRGNLNPYDVLWTSDRSPRNNGFQFGDSKTLGPRHLRLGFTESLPVGTVVTLGDVQVSALASAYAYPGDLTEDRQWISAERLGDDGPTQEEPGRNEIAFWVFPPNTETRALRFTHVSKPQDPEPTGNLEGCLILQERLINVAPNAQVHSVDNNKKAGKLTNAIPEGWAAWDNLSFNSPHLASVPVISNEHPQIVLLNWAEPVRLEAIMTLWTGFGTVEVQKYTGPETTHPRDAADSDWTTIGTYTELRSGYPMDFWPIRLPFDQPVSTGALRLRITGALEHEDHSHIKNKPAEGKRVWLGELAALQPIGSTPLADVRIPRIEAESVHPPIPIRFTLPEAGYVTLVIENADGMRVRNLVSETPFPAGENTAWWDGTDDLGRDIDAADRGLYRIPARFVEPGEYTVRGLWRKAIRPVYEFTAYNNGNPPWGLPDHTGAWLANHSAPSSAAFVPASRSPTGEPAIFLGAFVTEGPDGLIWTDLDMTKRGGMKWIGGNWTAAPYIGSDVGHEADQQTALYVASVWETAKKSGVEELRVNALEKREDGRLRAREVYRGDLGENEEGKFLFSIRGIAAYNGMLVISDNRRNRLLFLDAASGEILQTYPAEDPRGLAFDTKGNLYVLAQTGLLGFVPSKGLDALNPIVLIDRDILEDPHGIAIHPDGRVLISDHGNSHQVKVFAYSAEAVAEGEASFQPIGFIGKAGRPGVGPYDPLQMNDPLGLALDSQGRLWVTEHNNLPKRISIWSLDGELVDAEYGPSQYGGGGQLDPNDRNRFYYAENSGALEFALDWETGESEVKSVLFRQSESPLKLPRYISPPETAIYHNGQRYFHNSYNSNPTNGANSAVLFIDRNDVAVPVAAIGRANDWPELKTPPFLDHWPKSTDPNGNEWVNGGKNQALFIWSDQNGNTTMEPEEVTFYQGSNMGITVMNDLSFIVARFEEETIRFRPIALLANGVPQYDYETGEVLATQVAPRKSTGGSQALADDSDELVLTLGMEPFSPYSITGATNGAPKWSYPNLWPGLHASHHAAKPEAPGQVIGATRLMGGFVHPEGSEVAPLWALNANMGNFYLFTRDGLFVATVFEDSRTGTRWKMQQEVRGMSLEGLTLSDENFWPTISQTSNGKIYVVDGGNTAILRLDGLETLRPIPPQSIEVTRDQLQAAQSYVEQAEALRQEAFGRGTLTATMTNEAPIIDGQLTEWTKASWVEIDTRGEGANFNSSAKPYRALGALRSDGENLYAAWDTRDEGLLKNSGESPDALFVTGGALDLMFATDSEADPTRKTPTVGDLRLTVTQVDGETRALLYRQVAPDAPETDRVTFTSPVWSVTFDQVVDVSDQVQVAGNGEGGYEVAVPLDVLGLSIAPGHKMKGDIGLLRGNGTETTARVYWANKATGITADVPSEAKLSPHLWGTILWKENDSP